MRHVLDLKENIISLSIPDLKGLKYINEDRVLKISKDDRVVMKG